MNKKKAIERELVVGEHSENIYIFAAGFYFWRVGGRTGKVVVVLN